MSGLILTITDAGRAALVNAGNTGTNPVLMASVGVSATSFAPTPAATILPDEIKRITTIAGEAVADDTIHVTVRDESADIYTVRSFGLYLADGTLFAVYSQANPIMEKSAQALLLLAIDVIFADIEATDIAFGDASFANPPATTERQGVVELATVDEATTGSDATRAVTPKVLKAAVTSWLNSRFGEGAPSDFVKTLLISASAAALRLSLGIKSAALKDEGDFASAAHGHDIANITGLQGALNAKLAANSYTSADVLAKLLTVDGPGSGLDADTLHGHVPSASDLPLTVMSRDAVGRSWSRGIDRNVSGGVGDSWADGGNTRYWVGALGGTLYIGRNGTSFHSGSGGLALTSTGDLWFNGVTVWHAGNDGAGSGLDADFFRGLAPSAFAQLSGAYFTGSIGTAGDIYLTYGGAPGSLGISVSGTAMAFYNGITSAYENVLYNWLGSGGASKMTLNEGGVLRVLGNPVWHAGNDGAGSGSDADMLDGLHASDFAKLADFVASKTINGYCILPNGMILQAGRYSQNANSLISVVFPLAFPSLCMGVVTGGTGDSDFGAEGNTPTVYSGSVTAGGFQSHNANDNGTTAYFIAFGY